VISEGRESLDTKGAESARAESRQHSPSSREAENSDGLSPLEVGDNSAAGLDQLARLDPEHVVPRPGGGPHFVVLQQVRVNEDAQLFLVTKRWHASSGFVNPRV
jgi:hypothetical protein